MIKNAWILSLYSNSSYYNSTSIKKALDRRNISSSHIMVRNLYLNNNNFYYNDNHISKPDIIYSINQFFYRSDPSNIIVKRLFDIEKSGLYCTNSITSTFLATNKWTSYSILKDNNILTPETVLIDRNTEYNGSISERLGVPFVVKLIMGCSGVRYKLCYSEKQLQEIFNRYYRVYNDYEILAQQFLDSSAGMIITVGVVKDICYKAVIRIGDPCSDSAFLQDTEANRTQIAFNIDSELRQTVDKVMDAFKLDSARIDTMLYDNKYYVLEANPPGGLNITDLMHNYNIADDIVERSLRV
jgi:glutathione synthase/RimK-type ligase-like ATP-grasp enzyme